VRRRVSDKVGDTRNNRAELIEPIPEDTPKREKKLKRTKPKKESPPQGLFDWFSDTSELFGIDPYPSPTADNLMGRDANRPTWSQVVQAPPTSPPPQLLIHSKGFLFRFRFNQWDGYASRMPSLSPRLEPTLAIGYDEETYAPATGACLACGEYLPSPPPSIKTPESLLAWFQSQFSQHLSAKHPGRRPT
jgi:hypothetical protein